MGSELGKSQRRRVSEDSTGNSSRIGECRNPPPRRYVEFHDFFFCFQVVYHRKSEPTSALDAVTSNIVEKHLLDEIKDTSGTLKAIVWITHSSDQGKRVGTRFLRVTAGGIHEDNAIQEA